MVDGVVGGFGDLVMTGGEGASVADGALAAAVTTVGGRGVRAPRWALHVRRPELHENKAVSGRDFAEVARSRVAAARMGRVTSSTADLWYHYGRSHASCDRVVPDTFYWNCGQDAVPVRRSWAT